MKALRAIALVLLYAVGGLVLASVLGVVFTLRAVKAAGIKATWRVLFWARLWSLLYRVPYKLVLAILSNEGASVPDHSGRYPLGDLTSSKGPACGPGQVLRINVERLWTGVGLLYPVAQWPLTDPQQLADLGNERQALWCAVKVMREELDAAKGDEHEAARRYNGSGAKAEAYADKADHVRTQFA